MCDLYIKKNGKLTSVKTNGEFKPIADMDSTISGVRRSRLVRRRTGKVFLCRTMAYSKTVNEKR